MFERVFSILSPFSPPLFGPGGLDLRPLYFSWPLFALSVLVCFFVNAVAQRALHSSFARWQLDYVTQNDWTMRTVSTVHAIFLLFPSAYCLDYWHWENVIVGICPYAGVSVSVSAGYFLFDFVQAFIVDRESRRRSAAQFRTDSRLRLEALEALPTGSVQRQQAQLDYDKFIVTRPRVVLLGGPVYTLHHVVSTACQVISVVDHVCPLQLSLVQFTEITTPFLNGLWCMDALKAHNSLFLVSSVFFLLLWIVFRLLWSPYVLYLVWAGWPEIKLFKWYVQPTLVFSVSSLVVLNTWWFWKLVQKGMRKMASGKKKRAEDATKEH